MTCDETGRTGAPTGVSFTADKAQQQAEK